MLSTIATNRSANLISPHVIDSDTAPWRGIHAQGINLMLWPRKLPAFVTAALANRQMATVSVHETVPADAGHGDWFDRLVDAGADPMLSNWLARDICMLVRAFADVCGREQIQMHLKTLHDDECRLFHVDRNHLRLLCTYLGPGTQWLTNAQVERTRLGQGNNRQIVKYGRAQQAATGTVLLLKGERYPGNSGNGIVHRSPPVRVRNLRRLRLRLDLPDSRGC